MEELVKKLIEVCPEDNFYLHQSATNLLVSVSADGWVNYIWWDFENEYIDIDSFLLDSHTNTEMWVPLEEGEVTPVIMNIIEELIFQAENYS